MSWWWELCKCLCNGHFLEAREAQNLQNSVEAGIQMQTFFQNGDEQINGDGTPDLGAHGVGAGAVKGFDAQMLLDPFEKHFDLPTALVELNDGQRRHGEVVGQKDQRRAGFRVTIADAAQRVGIVNLGVKSGGHDRLVESQASGFVDGAGVTAGAAEVVLGASNEESAAVMEAMPPGKVEVAAIHDVERAGFPDQLVEDVDVVNTARRNNDDRGKVAVQVQQGVEFDGGLMPPERGPRKQREAEINGGGIQSVSGGLQIAAERFIRIERGGLMDEDLGEVGKDAPVPIFVGVSQGAAGGWLADARVIELWTEGRQTGFDVTQTFTPSELGERQHEELFVSGQFADAEVAVVTGDTLVELVFGQEVKELGEDGATFVHRVKNRRFAVEHPQGVVAVLKSKKDRTARKRRFYRAQIGVRKILTGQ